MGSVIVVNGIFANAKCLHLVKSRHHSRVVNAGGSVSSRVTTAKIRISGRLSPVGPASANTVYA
jgi:hypothetical protein